MTKRPQVTPFIQVTEATITSRKFGASTPFMLQERSARSGGSDRLLNERVLEDISFENGEQRPEARNAGADDGYIGLDGSPDTEIDTNP